MEAKEIIDEMEIISKEMIILREKYDKIEAELIKIMQNAKKKR